MINLRTIALFILGGVLIHLSKYVQLDESRGILLIGASLAYFTAGFIQGRQP